MMLIDISLPGQLCATAEAHSTVASASQCMGMVDGRGYNGQQKKMLFLIFVDHAKRFEAHSSQFVTDSD